MATATPAYNPPIAGGGLEVGVTTITSGTDTRLLFQDGSVVGQDALLTYSKTLDALASGSAAVDLAGIIGGGHRGLIQVRESNNGGTWIYVANSNNGAGARGGVVLDGSGANIGKLEQFGTGYTGSFLGQVMAGYIGLESQEEMAIGSTGAFPVLFGAANAEYFRMDGTGGTGVRFAKAITMTPTELADAAVAATSTVGLGNYNFSGLTANRAHTLVARSSVVKGYEVTYSLTDSPGAFAVNLTRNGTDTILGGTSVYPLNTDRESVTFRAAGTTDWIVVASS